MSWKLKDEELEFIDENEEQIKSYVGKKADDYINIWREGKKFNPAALFLGMIWLGYRGMYKVIMYLIIAFILTDILMIYRNRFDKYLWNSGWCDFRNFWKLLVFFTGKKRYTGRERKMFGWWNRNNFIFGNACWICIVFNLCH